MKELTMVMDVAIAAGASANVDIGVFLPLRRAVGIVSAFDAVPAVAGAHRLAPAGYTATVVDRNTINIAVVAGATALASGDILSVLVEEVGDICRV